MLFLLFFANKKTQLTVTVIVGLGPGGLKSCWDLLESQTSNPSHLMIVNLLVWGPLVWIPGIFEKTQAANPLSTKQNNLEQIPKRVFFHEHL